MARAKQRAEEGGANQLFNSVEESKCVHEDKVCGASECPVQYNRASYIYSDSLHTTYTATHTLSGDKAKR